MHIVHIKEGYNSLAEAVRDDTGVAVLGFFFEVSLFVYPVKTNGEQLKIEV